MLQIEDNKNEFLAEQLELLKSKQSPDSDIEWCDISNFRTSYTGVVENTDTVRKGSKIFYEFLKEGWINPPKENIDTSQIDEKIKELQSERLKLQAMKIAPNRIDRQQNRFELFYENIRDALVELEPPVFQYSTSCENKKDREYVLSIADIHAGSNFKSLNNEYSFEICKNRFEKLYSYVVDYVSENNINNLKILFLGDDIQGILRISDLKLNESTIVEATVFVAKIISEFLNKVSQYVNIDAYFVPTANHSQMRNLGTKASELAGEDIEFVINNYVKDVLINNDRVKVNLNSGNEHIFVPICGVDAIAMHGHQISNVSMAIRDLSMQHRRFFSYLFLAHFHAATEMIVGESEAGGDVEVLVCPPFIGSCPFSDRLMRGAKASCKIFIFDPINGHTGTEKIILN